MVKRSPSLTASDRLSWGTQRLRSGLPTRRKYSNRETHLWICSLSREISIRHRNLLRHEIWKCGASASHRFTRAPQVGSYLLHGFLPKAPSSHPCEIAIKFADTMAGIQEQLDRGAVPNHISNVCPKGTKFHVLEVGWLECDEAFVIRGGNTSLKSTEGKSFVNKRRELPMYCILIEHPHEGLILWETGCGKDYPEVWGPQVADVFSRVRYEPRHELKAAVEATGNKLEDIKKIIIGHLHLDHAGGLDMFLDRKDVEIWVHDKELRSAFWSVATGADVGVYLEHYLKLSL